MIVALCILAINVFLGCLLISFALNDIGKQMTEKNRLKKVELAAKGIKFE